MGWWVLFVWRRCCLRKPFTSKFTNSDSHREAASPAATRASKRLPRALTRGTSPVHPMASIPNLNTLRTGRRGPRLRGGRGGSEAPGHGDGHGRDVEAGRDAIIQQTDQDASSSRISAVELGYLDDPFAKLLLIEGAQTPRRYPIINRGTYVRTKAIDRLVTCFLQANPDQPKQIVSLGAGSDTRFFRLAAELADDKQSLAYHELDFEVNINQKRTALREKAQLADALKKAEKNGWKYHSHALDLRRLTEKSPPPIPSFDAELPTLLLSECCLCYLPPDAAGSVIQYFTMNVKASLALILYEPIRPSDSFGRTMVRNLASRGVHMQTLGRFSTPGAERQRLRLAGLKDGQGARDVAQIYLDDAWVTAEERERIDKLEWLDEIEEWNLLAGHYCVAWGWRGGVFSEAWRDIDGSQTADESSSKWT